MNSIKSSPKRIEKVSSDSVAVGFDLMSNLMYMAVLSMGGLPRDQILEQCGRQRFKTAVFFEYVHLLGKRFGLEYTHAFQLVAQKARARSVKSLLLRFAASISSGESESQFVRQEARIEAERYANVYDRSIESLKKWTDAYAAVLFSVVLVMVVWKPGKKRPKKSEGPDSSAEATQMEAVAAQFGISQPPQSQGTPEVTAPPMPPAAAEEEQKLGPETAALFGRKEPTAEPEIRPLGGGLRLGTPAEGAAPPEPAPTPEVAPLGGGLRLGTPVTPAPEAAQATARQDIPVAASQIPERTAQRPEAKPKARPGSGEVLDSNATSLQGIFRKKVVANPYVKALLKRHGTVDVHQLSDELQESARSVLAVETVEEEE